MAEPASGPLGEPAAGRRGRGRRRRCGRPPSRPPSSGGAAGASVHQRSSISHDSRTASTARPSMRQRAAALADAHADRLRGVEPLHLASQGVEGEAALGDARVGVDGEDAQGGLGAGGGAGLADRLAQALRSGRSPARCSSAPWAPPGGPKPSARRRRTSAGAGRPASLGASTRRMRLGSASGSRKTIRSRQVPPSTRHGGQDGGAQRAAAALAAGEQAVDEQAEPLLELRARRRLGQLELAPASRSSGTRGRRGTSLPRARSRARRPGAPKRSATAARGSLARSPSVAIPSRSSGSGRRRAPRRPRGPRRACAAGRPAAGRGTARALSLRRPRRGAGGRGRRRRARRSASARRRRAPAGRRRGAPR